MGLWVMLAAVVAAGVIGVVIQSGRSGSSSSGATPRHVLGPANSEVEGSATAPVLVEEYGDFQCPICAQFHAQVDPTIEQLVTAGTVRHAFHPMAFLGPESVNAASAAECVGDKGRYFPMLDVLYANQFPENSGALTSDQLVAFAVRAGAGDPGTAQCIRSGTYKGWANKVTEEASRRGVSSTPTVFVNGVRLADRSVNGLRAAVQAAQGG